MTCQQIAYNSFLDRLINHVMKSGSSLANTFGIVSVMYSGFGVLLSWARGTDDSLNTLAAATGTGMLFKSTCMFHLSNIYVAKKDSSIKFVQMID